MKDIGIGFHIFLSYAGCFSSTVLYFTLCFITCFINSYIILEIPVKSKPD